MKTAVGTPDNSIRRDRLAWIAQVLRGSVTFRRKVKPH